MIIEKAELAERIREAEEVLGSAVYSTNPRPWLLSALHRVFTDGYVEEVTGLKDSERTAFEALRDGSIVYASATGTKGGVDWDRTMAHLKAATLEQVREWAQKLIDLHGWLTVE